MPTSKNRRLAALLFVDIFGYTALMQNRELRTILFSDKSEPFPTNGSHKNLENTFKEENHKVSKVAVLKYKLQ